MKMTLKDAIGSLDYEDLVKLNEDLKEGGFDFKALIEQKIVEKEKEQGKYCHVCQNEIDLHSTNNYTILLGPEGLRRKASFCALDCLKYFISSMEERKKNVQKPDTE